MRCFTHVISPIIEAWTQLLRSLRASLRNLRFAIFAGIHVFTDDLEELHAEFVSRGAEITQPILRKPWGIAISAWPIRLRMS